MAQAEAKNAFDGIRPVSEAVAAKPGALDEGNLGAKTCGDTGGDEPAVPPPMTTRSMADDMGAA